MLQRTHIEAFVHGNSDADLARACLEQVLCELNLLLIKLNLLLT
jgi:hypothetical protein